jgi:hypothetical protein
MPTVIKTLTFSPEPIQDFITLSELATNLSSGFMSLARTNKSVIINDIPEDLFIDTDIELVASIFAGLLAAVVKNAKESYIRLSAKVYGNVILLHIKDHNNFNYSPVENKVRQLLPLAEKIGGSVCVTSQRNNVATFAFSFPNLPMAA